MFRESEDCEHFADFIRTKSRYVLDGWQQDFVNTIVECAAKVAVPFLASNRDPSFLV